MATRADFYVGRGSGARWVGSIAFDGYPDAIPRSVREATTETGYAEALMEFFTGREDVSGPDHGWPWPWDDSGTTDFAYAFDDGQVYGSSFGSEWFDPRNPMPEDLADDAAIFPDMSAVKNVAMGTPRDSIIIVTPRKAGDQA